MEGVDIVGRFERVDDDEGDTEEVDRRHERQTNTDLECDCDVCDCGNSNTCEDNDCKCCRKACTGESVVKGGR